MPNPFLMRDWTDSYKVNALDAHAERFFVRLMQKSDDYGRFHADPALLKSALFPLLTHVIRESDIPRWIAACEKAGLLRSYVAANGRKYLEVLDFGQRRKWMKSEYPTPEGQIALLAEQEIFSPPRRSRSRSRREERGERAGECESARPTCAAVPPVLKTEPEIKLSAAVKPVAVPVSSRPREFWQALRDEEALTKRITQERESAKPNAALLQSLKAERDKVRAEMTAQKPA